MCAGGEHSNILAADHGRTAAFIGGDGRCSDALGKAVLIGAEVPRAFKEHGVFAVDAVPCVHGAVHVADGKHLLVMQLHDLLHSCDAGVAVQIAAGLGKAVVGQHAAEQPEIRVHIPVADAGNVQGIGAAGLGSLDKLLHGSRDLVKPQLLEHVGVDNSRLAVGIQRQAVIFALIEIGRKRRVQIRCGKLCKVRVIAQRGQTALLGIGCDVGNVHTGHVRAHAGAEGGHNHLVVLAAVLTDSLDLDLGMKRFPKRHNDVQKLRFLAVAVGMPERDGDRFVLCGRVCLFRFVSLRRRIGCLCGCVGGIIRRRLLRLGLAAPCRAHHDHNDGQQQCDPF